MGGRRREVAPKGGETGSDLPSDTPTSCPRACPVADGPEGDPGVDRAVGLLTCGADGLLGSAVRLLVYLALTTGLGQTVGMVAGTQGPVAATAHTHALGRGWESCASPPWGSQLPSGGLSGPMVHGREVLGGASSRGRRSSPGYPAAWDCGSLRFLCRVGSRGRYLDSLC